MMKAAWKRSSARDAKIQLVIHVGIPKAYFIQRASPRRVSVDVVPVLVGTHEMCLHCQKEYGRGSTT